MSVVAGWWLQQQHVAIMTFRGRYFSLICACMAGLLLMAITTFWYSVYLLKLNLTHVQFVANDTKLENRLLIAADPVDGKTISYPWVGDPTCQHHPVQFAKKRSRPRWALTSFPGSGVTWTRQLIEGATGIYTGSVYGFKEPSIVSTGHFGNFVDLNCECTILIKDHDGTQVYNLDDYAKLTSNLTRDPARRDYYQHRGILLLRNPIDALFTYAHYLVSGEDQKGTVSPDQFQGGDWDEHIDYVSFTWADHAERWIKNIQHGTVVFYERLLQDTEGELKRLLKAIEFIDPNHPPVDEERMRCTVKHKHRTDRKRAKKPTVSLSSKQYAKLMSSIDKVQGQLRKKGWPLLPVNLYNLQKPELSSIA